MTTDVRFSQVAEIESLLQQAGRICEKIDIADVIPASQADALISMLRMIVERGRKRKKESYSVDPY